MKVLPKDEQNKLYRPTSYIVGRTRWYIFFKSENFKNPQKNRIVLFNVKIETSNK